MAWFLQTPESISPKLLANIANECGAASKGAAAFAFASAGGVKMLAADAAFDKFLKASEFVMIIGLDAITDTKALEELRRIRKKRPNFKPKLFLHQTAGSLFHPKTLWLKTADGGVIITGSGNLTLGGLKSNWEALAVEKVNAAAMAAAEKSWDAWLKKHAKELLDLDDAKAITKAESNKKIKARVKKVITTPDKEGAEEAEAEVAGELEHELQLNPVLVAEIPKASNRWEQANFDKKSFVEFFGVNMATPKSVQFFNVQADGSLVAEKPRPAVAVKSRNFRFELAAAKGLAYPKTGVPIAVFERISDSDFKYVLLMPSQAEHKQFADFLNSTYPKQPNRLRRVQITSGDLQKIWPSSPIFL